jgi:hypothetical protein
MRYLSLGRGPSRWIVRLGVQFMPYNSDVEVIDTPRNRHWIAHSAIKLRPATTWSTFTWFRRSWREWSTRT